MPTFHPTPTGVAATIDRMNGRRTLTTSERAYASTSVKDCRISDRKPLPVRSKTPTSITSGLTREIAQEVADGPREVAPRKRANRKRTPKQDRRRAYVLAELKARGYAVA